MHILLTNVHSARNLGDAGIMQATLGELRRVYPHAQITVAANDPASWQGRGLDRVVPALAHWFGDPALGRWHGILWRLPLTTLLLGLVALLYQCFGWPLLWGNPAQRALLRAYYQADLILSCGGGNFYAARPFSPGFVMGLLTIGWPLLLGKRVLLLPQSIGPIQGRIQQQLARQVFNRATHIWVREPNSVEYARTVLRLKRPVALLPDLALALPAPRPASLPGTLKIAIVPMDRGAQRAGFGGQHAYEDALLALALRLHSVHQAHIYLIAQCTGPSADQDDRQIAQRLHVWLTQAGVNAMVLADFDDARAVQATYAAMDCVIATRMHAAIFALTSHTPVVALGYQPKSCGLMGMLGLDDFCLPLEVVTPSRLVTLVEAILADPAPVRIRIAQAMTQARTTLAGWGERLNS